MIHIKIFSLTTGLLAIRHHIGIYYVSTINPFWKSQWWNI